MKKDEIKSVLEFMLNNSSKLNDDEVFELIEVFVNYIENQMCGFSKEVKEETFKRVIKPIFTKYLEDWIASYDDLDDRINQVISYRKEIEK